MNRLFHPFKPYQCLFEDWKALWARGYEMAAERLASIQATMDDVVQSKNEMIQLQYSLLETNNAVIQRQERTIETKDAFIEVRALAFTSHPSIHASSVAQAQRTTIRAMVRMMAALAASSGLSLPPREPEPRRLAMLSHLRGFTNSLISCPLIYEQLLRSYCIRLLDALFNGPIQCHPFQVIRIVFKINPHL